ncbi:MAG: DoxX family protein [Bacteroidetes bacterium]|nr:DoxX family protein [Bacteroidota bacterium]
MGQTSHARLHMLHWSFTKKILFRFVFLFFLLFIFFNPNDILPLNNPFYDFYSRPFHRLVPWIGAHILHLSYPITMFPLGSFDTTYDYVILLLIVVISLLGCLVWSLLDRRRSHYRVLYYWLTVVLRYYCAYSMFSYGSVKLSKLQFGFPSPGSLVQPLGTYSPMHLAWAFYGYSTGYNYFLGVAEVVTGMLLLFRRTTRLGAICLLAVMSNVMAVNYFYDVGLKLVSTAMVLMSLFLLVEERWRLLDFFIRNKITVPQSNWAPRFGRKWVNRSLVAFKYVLTVSIVTNIIIVNYRLLADWSDQRTTSPFHGIFNVETFIRNNDTIAPLLTDTTRWRRLTISDHGSYGINASVRLMNDSAKAYVLKPDTVSRQVILYRPSDTSRKFYFTYAFTGNDGLRLKGSWKGDSVQVVLHKYDMNNFILINRGFHFINEESYVR